MTELTFSSLFHNNQLRNIFSDMLVNMLTHKKKPLGKQANKKMIITFEAEDFI